VWNTRKELSEYWLAIAAMQDWSDGKAFWALLKG
jgi:hypothetical protein